MFDLDKVMDFHTGLKQATSYHPGGAWNIPS